MIIFNRVKIDLDLENPFECDDQFSYDKEELNRSHGSGALIHLGVGTADSDPMSLEVILDHQPAFERWLFKHKRNAELVDDHTVGLKWIEDGRRFVNKLCVVISKPYT